MNILHIKYAVEVARLGSLNKASEALLIAQPNISRSIKELEADLGITIFQRSARGMILTPEGEEFIERAEEILKQIDDVELLYKCGAHKKQRFSVSVPRSCYIAQAFAAFSASLESGAAELVCEETNAQKVIGNVLNKHHGLGIIRYAERYEKHFKLSLEEKGLALEPVAEFTPLLTFNGSGPLSQSKQIAFSDLTPLTEIAFADPYAPSLPLSKVIKEELPDTADRRILLFDRAGMLELLSKDPQAFAWCEPIPQSTLERYGLVQRECTDQSKRYKDALVYREGYKLSKADKSFLSALFLTKADAFAKENAENDNLSGKFIKEI